MKRKKCPFCGAKSCSVIPVKVPDPLGSHFYVTECNECGAQGPPVCQGVLTERAARMNALVDWNIRAKA